LTLEATQAFTKESWYPKGFKILPRWRFDS